MTLLARQVIHYTAESPDELALVIGAERLGMQLTARRGGAVGVRHFCAPLQQCVARPKPSSRSGASWRVCRDRYALLGVHPFDSDRKRMSVVLRAPDRSVIPPRRQLPAASPASC